MDELRDLFEELVATQPRQCDRTMDVMRRHDRAWRLRNRLGIGGVAAAIALLLLLRYVILCAR
jgi:hypothetical protein